MNNRARLFLALALGVIVGLAYEVLKTIPGEVAAIVILASWLPVTLALFAYAFAADRADRRRGIEVA